MGHPAADVGPVDEATHALYGADPEADAVAVINTATCNATRSSGCAHPAATVAVGSGPYGVAVDDRTHTVYIVNNANGDAPGTVSVINGATCNGTDIPAATSTSAP